MSNKKLATITLSLLLLAPQVMANEVVFTESDKNAIEQAMQEGASLTQAVSDAITKDPSKADIIVAVALSINPALVDEIVEIALNIAPDSSVNIINAVVSTFGNNSDVALDTVAATLSSNATNDAETTRILETASKSGINRDTLTTIAVASGIDATLASEATAAGPLPTPTGAPAPVITPPAVTIPTITTQGAGGGGGDGGISEGNA